MRNRRIHAVADELRRLCQLHETQHGAGSKHIANARPATQVMIDTYMAALGFTKTDLEGRFTNGIYEAWDLLPRNVLVDQEGDLYVVDAEIRKL